ncbi:uncharacterized protein LOC134064317 [Sardina pilchardus]|uniref:uncharacterized protein LOC134064317 n=1 Tax=Sardina pilchardus TaxID=27697 RepID=UPI002E118838
MADMSPKLSRAVRLQKKLHNSLWLDQANSLMKTAFNQWKVSQNLYVTQLLDEMVHSILFSGHIRNQLMKPEEIFEADMFGILRCFFGGAFEGYKRRLPKRTPFSCLLELIVETKKDKTLVKNELSNIITKLRGKSTNQLVGRALCIIEECQQISYGVSMPLAEKQFKKIWIALSCMHTWHPHVAYAVRKWTKGEECSVPFPNLEESCQAYVHNGKTLKSTPPCISCCELFSMKHVHKKSRSHLYGNCAEAEAISKYLKLKCVPHLDEPTLISDIKNDLKTKLETVKNSNFDPTVVYEPAPISDDRIKLLFQQISGLL